MEGITKAVSVLAMSMVLSSVAIAQTGPAKADGPCTPGNISEVQPEISEELGRFLGALQSAVMKSDKDAAAELFNYPFTVHTRTGKFIVKNKDEFVQKYNRILPRALIDLIKSQETECLNQVGAKGFMLGRGEVWVAKFPDNGLQVFSINLVFY